MTIDTKEAIAGLGMGLTAVASLQFLWDGSETTGFAIFLAIGLILIAVARYCWRDETWDRADLLKGAAALIVADASIFAYCAIDSWDAELLAILAGCAAACVLALAGLKGGSADRRGARFFNGQPLTAPMEPVRIALAQMRCVAGDVEGNMSRALESVDQAATHGANLLVLPEMCLTGYATDGDLPRLPHEGGEVRDLAVRAGEKGMAVCAGLCERCDGMPYDTEVVVEKGELKGYYRKTHLGEREKAAFAAGDHIHCIHTSLGVLGTPTCWECRFPEISTVMALQGADALLVPTASGLSAERRREVWDRVLPARAADNSCFVAAVNARGDNGRGVVFGGGATVRGPHGELIAENYDGDMLVADLDPAELGMRRRNYDTMRDVYYLSRRRPELYGDIVKGRWRARHIIARTCDTYNRIQTMGRTMTDDRTGLKNRGHTHADVDERREAVEQFTGRSLERVAKYCFKAEDAEHNIENMIGATQIPLGFAGPVTVHGEYAVGDFLVPMATTEGALVASVSRGMSVISKAGGARTKVFADYMTRAPVLRVRDLEHACQVMQWLDAHEKDVIAAAEATTRHGKVHRIERFPTGRSIYLRFSYETGDAMGMNMATVATEAACRYIEKETGAVMVSVSGNMCSDKKAAAINMIEGRGKIVVAEARIPGDMVEQKLHASVEAIVETNVRKNLIGSNMAGMLGGNAHAANMAAAVYIATGQDPAQVVESSLTLTDCEDVDGDLYISVRMPSVEVGTVGGGTKLPTQAEALDMIGCRGEGKARKLAEIVAATVLAGELSTLAAQAAGQLGAAHQALGRNR